MSSEPPVHPRRAWRVALYWLLAVVLVIGVALAWLLGTASGARTVVAAAGRIMGEALQVDAIDGRLAGPLHIERLRFDREGMQVDLQDIDIDWQPRSLLQGRVHLRSLRIGALNVTSQIKQKEDKPPQLPASIDLPVKLAIDSAQIDRGAISWGPLNLIELDALALSLYYDGAHYRFKLAQLAAGTASGASDVDGKLRGELQLSTTQPYPIAGSFTADAAAQVKEQQYRGGGSIGLQGSLAEMTSAIDLAIGEAKVNGQVVLRPFTALPLGDANLRLQALDLAAFGVGLPQTRLDGTLVANAEGGKLALTNDDAGPYDAERVPLRSFVLNFRQDAKGFTFDKITAALGSAAKPAGDISGSGSLANGALALNLTTPALNLQRLDTRLMPTQLAGRADIRHIEGKQELVLALSEPLNKNRLHLDLRASLADEELRIQRAELALADGKLQAAGMVQLAGKQAFRLEGNIRRLRLQDLGQFPQLPQAVLNGEFLLQGARAPQLAADLTFRITDSMLAGHALRGDGNLRLRGDSLDIPGLNLAAGDNRLQVQGRLADSGGQLSFDVNAPRLAQFGPQFAGSLMLKGSATGSFERPRIVAAWNAKQLKMPGQLQIGSTDGKADIRIARNAPFSLAAASVNLTASDLKQGAQQVGTLTAAIDFSPQPNAPLSLQIQAQRLSAATLAADSVSLDARGTTADHALDAKLAAPGQQWQLRAEGGLSQLAAAPRWQGDITQINASGDLQAKLSSPAPILLSQQKIELERLRLDSSAALVMVERFVRDARGIATSGRFERLQLAALLPYLQKKSALTTDLQLGGQWDVTLAGKPRGTLSIRRERGDIATLGNAPVTLGLRQLQADVRADDGRLSLQFVADGAQLGNVNVDANVAIGSGLNISPQAPVSGKAKISMPSLRWAGPLITPTAATEGSLQSEITLAGSVAAPRFAGYINGTKLRLALPDLGIDLRDGTLASSFQDTRLVIQNLVFAQPGGQLSLSGPIDLAGSQPSAQLKLVAQQFAVLDRSDRRLVISGGTQINLDQGRLAVTGSVTANSGKIDIGRSDRPELSEDVVIVGETDQKAGKPMQLALDLAVSLGDGITIQGRGLDGRLVGQIKLTSDVGEPIRAEGNLRIRRGTFSAYGRELAIERGVLRFNGPVNNPTLDILAMRREQEVEAGVAVRGTVLAPRITLVSEPEVPDAEKLSWLVLGRGLDNATGGGDVAALQAAAGALLAQGAAAGVQSRLAATFGLDELSLGTSSDNLQQRIVTLGKQVSSRLYISIEQGLETASSVLQLRYRVSRRLSLEIDTGARTAFTLFYNFAFD